MAKLLNSNDLDRIKFGKAIFSFDFELLIVDGGGGGGSNDGSFGRSSGFCGGGDGGGSAVAGVGN